MDAIRLSCDSCGAGLKAPGHLAGKTLKCPKCGVPLQVPASTAGSLEADVIAAHVVPDPLTDHPHPLAVHADPLGTAPAAAAVAAPVALQTCPHCKSQIPGDASKCRHCGGKIRRRAVSSDDDKMQAIDYIVAFVFAPIGAIVGLLYLIRNYRKAYVMLGISLPMSLLAIGGGIGLLMLVSGNYFQPKVKEMAVASSPFENGGGNVPTWADEEGIEDGEPAEDVTREESGMTRPPSEDDLKQQPPEIQRAMRANVRIMQSSGALGSGVILQQSGGAALIITNRHVVDSAYSISRGLRGTPLERLRPLDVTFVNGDTEPGKVVWIGPDSVDLAIIKSLCPDNGIAVADCQSPPVITPGEDCFAIGNPIGLGWTFTKGTVSALRHIEIGDTEVPVIQTDTSINPGNSGGGLYNSRGQLIGINDFIINSELARNVGFAIRYEYVWELKPDVLAQLLEASN